MLLADFGTSYCKLLDTEAAAAPKIIPAREIPRDFQVDIGTGHNAKRRSKETLNELTALAKGGVRLIKDPDFVLLDCGSRDLKFVHFKNGIMEDMGWNTECGASMGFTIELLATYYHLDYAQVPIPASGFSVTCGVLGLSSIFDAVAAGSSELEAAGKFVRGIARNAWRFAGAPDKLYLSGGLCDNPLFTACFPCELISLGRFVLLEGLLATTEKEKD